MNNGPMRNAAIDVFRSCLMFGICMLHSISVCGHGASWLSNCLSWCVPAFVFITGWFGLQFSFMKLARLYSISFYCAVAFVGMEALISSHKVGGAAIFFQVWKIAIGQWFLNAYAVLMCFAPLLNKAVEYGARDFKHVFGPLMVVSFGWSFAMTLPILPRWIPQTPGLTAYSFLTLIGVYVIARSMRVADFRLPKLSRFVWAMAICLLLAFSAIGFNDYNSPVAICIAALSFIGFKRIKFPVLVERVSIWLGPSMFSVYLLHSHPAAFAYMSGLEDVLLAEHVPMVVVYLLTALVVFIVCVVIDIPRRFVCRFL